VSGQLADIGFAGSRFSRDGGGGGCVHFVQAHSATPFRRPLLVTRSPIVLPPSHLPLGPRWPHHVLASLGRSRSGPVGDHAAPCRFRSRPPSGGGRRTTRGSFKPTNAAVDPSLPLGVSLVIACGSFDRRGEVKMAAALCALCAIIMRRHCAHKRRRGLVDDGWLPPNPRWEMPAGVFFLCFWVIFRNELVLEYS
jgi:hypothetical protein